MISNMSIMVGLEVRVKFQQLSTARQGPEYFVDQPSLLTRMYCPRQMTEVRVTIVFSELTALTW